MSEGCRSVTILRLNSEASVPENHEIQARTSAERNSDSGCGMMRCDLGEPAGIIPQALFSSRWSSVLAPKARYTTS